MKNLNSMQNNSKIRFRKIKKLCLNCGAKKQKNRFAFTRSNLIGNCSSCASKGDVHLQCALINYAMPKKKEILKSDKEVGRRNKTFKKYKEESISSICDKSDSHECSICKLTFKYKYSLSDHYLQEHCKTSENPICPLCSKKCDTRLILSRHIQLVHNLGSVKPVIKLQGLAPVSENPSLKEEKSDVSGNKVITKDLRIRISRLNMSLFDGNHSMKIENLVEPSQNKVLLDKNALGEIKDETKVKSGDLESNRNYRISRKRSQNQPQKDHASHKRLRGTLLPKNTSVPDKTLPDSTSKTCRTSTRIQKLSQSEDPQATKRSKTGEELSIPEQINHSEQNCGNMEAQMVPESRKLRENKTTKDENHPKRKHLKRKFIPLEISKTESTHFRSRPPTPIPDVEQSTMEGSISEEIINLESSIRESRSLRSRKFIPLESSKTESKHFRSRPPTPIPDKKEPDVEQSTIVEKIINLKSLIAESRSLRSRKFVPLETSKAESTHFRSRPPTPLPEKKFEQSTMEKSSIEKVKNLESSVTESRSLRSRQVLEVDNDKNIRASKGKRKLSELHDETSSKCAKIKDRKSRFKLVKLNDSKLENKDFRSRPSTPIPTEAANSIENELVLSKSHPLKESLNTKELKEDLILHLESNKEQAESQDKVLENETSRKLRNNNKSSNLIKLKDSKTTEDVISKPSDPLIEENSTKIVKSKDLTRLKEQVITEKMKLRKSIRVDLSKSKDGPIMEKPLETIAKLKPTLEKSIQAPATKPVESEQSTKNKKLHITEDTVFLQPASLQETPKSQLSEEKCIQPKKKRRPSWTEDIDLHKDLRGFDELGIEHDERSSSNSIVLCQAEDMTINSSIKLKWMNGILSNITRPRSDFKKTMTDILEKICPEVNPNSVLFE